MVKYPSDQVRPVFVAVRTKGAYLFWKPPKEEIEVDHYVIFRSKIQELSADSKELFRTEIIESTIGDQKNEDLFTGKMDVKELAKVEKPSYTDSMIESNTKYAYYIYAVGKDGNYYHPESAAGRSLWKLW